MSGKSGVEIGVENVARLQAYLDGLAAVGEPLPMRAGKPNMSAIALACGFDRQVLYKNPAAVALIDEIVARAPAREPEADTDPEEKPRSDRRDQRIMQLEQQLAAARAENAGLRERLRRLQHIEEHVTETGRRIANPALPSFGGTGE
ncbi:hypothetical protein [Devosia sediminis]|uniref:Uncharacterized protein n=1 Tax=Devosia sediminis TaxID=2798801 RepID=A0A934IXS5_9HYPH|nr:hypothetical protein [Devosia sediminis]MBJ3784190.1 hypothetical protein [Devosia sediminis]